jgi:hypothetical protein
VTLAKATHRSKPLRSKKAWLGAGLDLEKRIAFGLPEMVNIIRLDVTLPDHVEQFREEAINSIREVQRGWGIDPSSIKQRRTLLSCAVQIRKATSGLTNGDWSWGNRKIVAAYARDLDLLAKEIEDAADRIAKRRSGGSDAARADKGRKFLSVQYAHALINQYGQVGPPTTTECKPLLQLSELIFEIATGNRTGSLKRAALDFLAKRFPGK